MGPHIYSLLYYNFNGTLVISFVGLYIVEALILLMIQYLIFVCVAVREDDVAGFAEEGACRTREKDRVWYSFFPNSKPSYLEKQVLLPHSGGRVC